jgi:hypothetical protein
VDDSISVDIVEADLKITSVSFYLHHD